MLESLTSPHHPAKEPKLSISATDACHTTRPDTAIGLLGILSVNSTQPATQLDRLKREVEARLQSQSAGFSCEDFIVLPVMAAYRAYCKQFKKTYHVQL